MLQSLADALQAIVDNTNEKDISVSSVKLGISTDVVSQLFALKYIECDLGRNVWMIPRGRTALEEHKQVLRNEQERLHEQHIDQGRDEAQRVSDRNKQFRHDWMIAVFAAVGGALLMYIGEHFNDIIALFK